MPELTEIIILTIAALAGATISGVVGMAGGLLLLSIMYVVGLDPLIAIPIHAVVQLVSNSTRVLAFLRHVRWAPLLITALVALPLPAVGLVLLRELESAHVKGAMGVLVLVATWLPKWNAQRLPRRIAFGLVGVIGGMFGVVIGAIGPLIAPFFLQPDFTKEQIIATKAVTQAYFHILKILAFMLAGSIGVGVTFNYIQHSQLIIPMTIAVIIGTLIGKMLLGRISEKAFRLFYKTVLTLLAIRLVLQPG